MSLVQRAQRAGRRIHWRANAVEVKYLYAAENVTKTLMLVPGLRGTESTTDAGVVIDRLMNEWIAEREQLDRDPQRGDIITYKDMEYSVLHPGGGREYDIRDPYAESVRIHCVGTSTATGVVVGESYGNAAGIGYGGASGAGYGVG